jgi:hypothetical protein
MTADVLGFAALASSVEGQYPIDPAIRAMVAEGNGAGHTLKDKISPISQSLGTNPT